MTATTSAPMVGERDDGFQGEGGRVRVSGEYKGSLLLALFCCYVMI